MVPHDVHGRLLLSRSPRIDALSCTCRDNERVFYLRLLMLDSQSLLLLLCGNSRTTVASTGAARAKDWHAFHVIM